MSRAGPHQVTRDFEAALCSYTGARFAVSTSSCTAALLIALQWHLRNVRTPINVFLPSRDPHTTGVVTQAWVEIPKRTYVGVAMSIRIAGGWPKFRDEDWMGEYQLAPFPLWDAARRFTSGMYRPGAMQCVSFHWAKILGVQQGGAVLLDDPEADAYLRRARFDGRTEGVPPAQDTFDMLGHHCYLSPEVAAQALMRLSFLPRHNRDLPPSDYSDLSIAPIFKGAP